MPDAPVENQEQQLLGVPHLTLDQRTGLLEAIQDIAPDWHRAYELRSQGVAGQDLAAAFELGTDQKPRTRAHAVSVLLGEELVGERKWPDRRASELAEHLVQTNAVDAVLAEYLAAVGTQARESYDRNEYSSPQVRAWATRRQLEVDEVEAQAELEEEVVDDVDTERAFQIYSWTYSGLLVASGPLIVKVGYAGTGPTSDAWRRMADSSRTTGSPGAPTMLRVWVGRGGREEAVEAESRMHAASGRRILGGGDEWFEASLDGLDSKADDLALERHFAVNPA